MHSVDAIVSMSGTEEVTFPDVCQLSTLQERSTLMKDSNSLIESSEARDSRNIHDSKHVVLHAV